MATSTATLLRNEWVPNATYAKPPEMVASKLNDLVDMSVDTQTTVQVFGPHGIGKTSTVRAACMRYPDTVTIRISAANITPDELITNAPVKLVDEEGRIRYALRELLMEALAGTNGRRFVLHIDDSLQASAAVGNQLFQLAANWTLGSFDLKKRGCIAVILTDNDSLHETAARRTDLALLDRMFTERITAADVDWKGALAALYPNHDLKGVFRVRAEMPAELRNNVMSPRALEHVVANLIEGNPGIWGLPMLNGHRVRLQASDRNGNPDDRTEEYLNRMASELGAPNPDRVADPVRRVVRQAIKNRWAVHMTGDPGCGKTEVTKAVIAEELGIDPMQYYFSMSTTDVDMLTVPMAMDGLLVQSLREDFYSDEDKVAIWDEFNRPKDQAAFAKLMEVTQEWTIAGQPIPGLRAQVAIQNPPYVMGRKLNVAKYNIAQADRFFASIEVMPGDIPANEWLLNEFPKKWVRSRIEVRELHGEAPLEDVEAAKEAAYNLEQAHRTAETVLEWWKNDIDDEGRNWVTARGRERLITAALTGRPLEQALIYVDGERAPVVLANLYARLADNPMTGLQEIAANLDEWVERMKAAKATSEQGTVDTDMVHMALVYSEVSQLREHEDTVVTLLMYLPPKYRLTYLASDGEKKAFWMGALAEMGKRVKA